MNWWMYWLLGVVAGIGVSVLYYRSKIRGIRQGYDSYLALELPDQFDKGLQFGIDWQHHDLYQQMVLQGGPVQVFSSNGRAVIVGLEKLVIASEVHVMNCNGVYQRLPVGD